MATHTDHDTHGQPSLDEPRPGQELRVARERAGISREFMAERLRLGLDQFDALEHDDYAELPPPAFVRGYFRAYARELGLDPDEYVTAYNRSGVSGRDPEIRSGGGVADTSSGGRGGMIGLLLIALVAAGGIGAWWYQQRMVDEGATSGTADSVEEERTATDNREAEAPDSGDAAGADTNDGAATDDGGDGAAPAGGDGDTASATAADGDAADAETAAPAGDAADTETASAEAGATVDGTDGDAAADADGADADAEDGNEAAEQPTVATPDREPPENGADGPAGDDTRVAGAGDATTGSGAEGDAVEDAAATEDDADDTGADTGTTAEEPGATSPAATDSPTRAATDAARTGPDEITLEFSARSWLEVYDDRDRELVYTLYFGSEPITLQGWAPFEIFLGNSPAVTVRFNGEEIDKSAYTRGNNTARFIVDASGVRAP